MLRAWWFFASIALLATAQPAGAAAAPPTIVPPPGWVAMKMNAPAPNLQMIGVWLAPVAKDGLSENINLLTEDTPLAFDDYVAAQKATLLQSMTKTFVQNADEDCADAKAHRFEYGLAFGERTLDITQLFRVVDGKAYIATYTRLPNTAADPAALTSLRTLCAPPVS